jgi:hypothetical protein
MPFSAYNSNGVRPLSAAHSEAMGLVQRASGHSLSEIGTSAVSTKLVNNLMKTHDSGERDPKALKRAALEGIFA